VLRLASQSPIRTVLVSNADFTQAARDAVEAANPIKIELVGFSDLVRWANLLRSERSSPEDGNPIRTVIKEFHRNLIRVVAADIRHFRDLEWRTVEEVMAEVFQGLGFKATLTPSSKDGGKDIILEYVIGGTKFVYYVEIKHWRSKSKVGSNVVKSFLKVVLRDNRKGGLLLSTYGFNGNAFESLTEIERHVVRHGGKEEMHAFCQYYEKARSGLWSAPTDLGTLLVGH
jgi:restriction system protein